jgi:hypothetical protein
VMLDQHHDIDVISSQCSFPFPFLVNYLSREIIGKEWVVIRGLKMPWFWFHEKLSEDRSWSSFRWISIMSLTILSIDIRFTLFHEACKEHGTMMNPRVDKRLLKSDLIRMRVMRMIGRIAK